MHVGDCRDVMAAMAPDSIDAIVTDPPYGLTQNKAGGSGDASYNAKSPAGRSRIGTGGGFMGMAWDHGVPGVEFWTAALRVAKPGAHLLAFGGTRTFHRLTCAIEDAGFEIRDCIMWVYSSGFPKSHNLDCLRGEVFCGCESESSSERDLRPVRSADVSAPQLAVEERREILHNGVPEQGASQHWFAWSEPESAGCEKSSLEWRRNHEAAERELQRGPVRPSTCVGTADGTSGRLHHGAPAGDGADVWVPSNQDGSSGPFGPQAIEQLAPELAALSDECGSQAWRGWPVCTGCGKPIIPAGYGTALKPAWEPIVLARKPLVGTVAENFTRFGTGAINVDACRVGTDGGCAGAGAGARVYGDGLNGTFAQPVPGLGRWPANLIHDGSNEVLAAFPDAPGQLAPESFSAPSSKTRNAFGERDRRPGGFGDVGADRGDPLPCGPMYSDAGSAARFFYCAKASREDRNEGCEGLAERPLNWSSGDQSPGTFQSEGTDRSSPNNHPTVKPSALMRYLCRLVTPPDGLILDPFAGSGSTGKAAMLEDLRFVGIDLDAEYVEIARRRIAHAASQPKQQLLALGAA